MEFLSTGCKVKYNPKAHNVLGSLLPKGAKSMRGKVLDQKPAPNVGYERRGFYVVVVQWDNGEVQNILRMYLSRCRATVSERKRLWS